MGEHDGILLERWTATGDQQAFMELVTRYQGMVFGVCVRIVKDRAKAEDLVQDCFLKLTSTRPKNIHILGPWLHRVATNASINQLSSDQRRQAREKKYMEDAQSAHEPSWDDISEILDEEINTLSIDSREAIVAHFLEGHTQVEVAQRLGITRQAVHKRIARGLDSLHRKLKSRGILVPAAALSGMLTSEIAVAATASLAATMGKAVLSGMFTPTKTATVALPKVLLLSAAALIVITGGFVALNTFGRAEQSDPIIPPAENLPVPETPVLASTEPVEPSTPILEEVSALGPPRIQWLDEEMIPVEGAFVYLFQRGRSPNPSAQVGDKTQVSRWSEGPIISDSEGYIEIDLRGFESTHTFAYALVPGKMVGAFSGNVSSDSSAEENVDRMVMVASKSVPGKVAIPPEFNMKNVKVDVLMVHVPSKFVRIGNTYDNPNIKYEGVWPGLFDVQVDAQGNFEIPNVPVGGGVVVRGYGPGLGDARGGKTGDLTARFINLRLEIEGVIEGTLRYADTGAVAAGRNVFSKNRTAATIQHVAATDAFGNYRFTGLGPGMYEVKADIEQVPQPEISRPESDLEVETGLVTDGVDLLIERGIVIHGTTKIQETGEPVEHARISAVTLHRKSVVINSTVSDASGQYEMRLPMGENKLYISSTPNGFSRIKKKDERVITLSSDDIPAGSFDFNFKKGSSGEMTVYIKEMIIAKDNTDLATTITGRVFDSTRNALEGVQIILMKKVDMGGGMSTNRNTIGKTDSEGRFSMAMEPDREYRVVIGGEGWSAWRGKRFTAKKETVRSIDDVILEKFSSELSFEIVNEDGRPIAHTQYSVSNKNYHYEGNSRTSDTNGFFHIGQLPDGDVKIALYHEGYERYKWDGPTGQHVKVTMKRLGESIQ
jgi:RNA polymerase sigma factor (sigma-70 family)